MKVTETQIAIIIIALIALGLYLYNHKSIYYPVYGHENVYRQNVYMPYPRVRPGHRDRKPGHRPHPGRPHPGIKPGKDWHIGPDGKYLPGNKGGVIPFTPL